MDYTDIKKHISFQCTVCGGTSAEDNTPRYICDPCGQAGTLDLKMQRSRPPQRDLSAPLNMWTQRDLLPVDGTILPGLASLGGTPLIGYEALERMAVTLDVAGVCIKNDGLGLSGSLKDRASAMVVQHAVKKLDRHVIATASTGNAAAALACCCAVVPEAEAIIFVPKSAPEGKIAQMLVFGANVVLVDGDYDTAFDLCWEACNEFGWYNRSTGINPYTSEGKKTVVHEIAYQLNWQMPDVIVVSAGDGSIISGVHRGCQELYDLGWTDRVPRLIGVQSAGSDALVYAWERALCATKMEGRPANTIADSISSRLPRDRSKALRAVRETDGAYIRVSDAEILHAIPALARQSGVFAEPASAASYAGLMAARQDRLVSKNETVLLLMTGNGLKDSRSAMQSVASSERIVEVAPTLSALARAINKFDERKR